MPATPNNTNQLKKKIKNMENEINRTTGQALGCTAAIIHLLKQLNDSFDKDAVLGILDNLLSFSNLPDSVKNTAEKLINDIDNHFPKKTDDQSS